MTQQPAPSRVFGVGVTGHRPNKLPAGAVARIAQQLRAVMTTIDRAVRAQSQDRPIRLISGFAEGIDQMAVAAVPAGWAVKGILPFPRAEYLKDFEQSAAGDGRDVRPEFLASLARATSVRELAMPDSAPREQAYLAAGQAMLRHSDLLIAGWDGDAGKLGGTGHIVQEARDAGIPVVWLATNADRDPVLIEDLRDGAPIASARPWASAISFQPTRAARA